MVQKYICALSNREAVISRAGAIAAATILLKKTQNCWKDRFGNLVLGIFLFMCMDYVQQKNTSSKLEIPDKA